MKRTKLLKTQPCEAPRISSEEDVICASQIVEADGEKALEISLFYKGKLRGRYFADEENHNAWIDGKWYTLRLKNVIRVCMDASPLKNDYYYCTPSTKWAAPEDKERAYDFLDTYGIEDYEVRLGARKRQKAFERKLERIDQMMADVPCVPEDAETWMENEIFPENILFFKKRGKADHIQLYRLRSYKLAKESLEAWRKNSLPEVRETSDGQLPAAGADQERADCHITAVWQRVDRAPVPGNLQMELRREKRDPAQRGDQGDHSGRTALGQGVVWNHIQCRRI